VSIFNEEDQKCLKKFCRKYL